MCFCSVLCTKKRQRRLARVRAWPFLECGASRVGRQPDLSERCCRFVFLYNTNRPPRGLVLYYTIIQTGRPGSVCVIRSSRPTGKSSIFIRGTPPKVPFLERSVHKEAKTTVSAGSGLIFLEARREPGGPGAWSFRARGPHLFPRPLAGPPSRDVVSGSPGPGGALCIIHDPGGRVLCIIHFCIIQVYNV